MTGDNRQPLVAVLMSTYNGEQYLKDQIDSILKQKDVTVQLYIRDDGSSDQTATILKSYASLENVYTKMGTNVGVGRAFMSLVYDESIHADYYAFSDQDDIWLEDKLSRAVGMIHEAEESEPSKRPILYAGNQTLIDATGKELGDRFQEPVPVEYHRVLAANLLSGCTMVFNQELMNLLRDKKRRPPMETFTTTVLHDVWVAWAAAICGKTLFDMEGKILYRQHDHNVVGAFAKSKAEVHRDQIHKLVSRKNRNPRMKRAGYALKYFPEYVSDKKDLQHYAGYKHSLKDRLWLLRDDQTIRYTHEKRIGYWLKVILGLV